MEVTLHPAIPLRAALTQLVACGAMLCALAAAAGDVNIGIIGVDTGHATAFAKIMNVDRDPDVAGFRVTHAYKWGSRDIASCTNRYEGNIRALEGFGVKMTESIAELLANVDCVLLETCDGRPHLEQAREVFKSGKPCFIDKPIAADLRDSLRILKLAKDTGQKVFTASSLRYTKAVKEAVRGDFGKIRAVSTFAPGNFEPTHSDYFWYAIHGADPLFAIMGTGCEDVTSVRAADGDVIVGRWKDGRLGTMQVFGKNGGYGGSAITDKGKLVSLGGYEGYKVLLMEILEYFRTGKEPIHPDEIKEVYAFLDAARISRERGGRPVSIAEAISLAESPSGLCGQSLEDLKVLDREIAAFKAECERANKPLGAPDEVGNFILSPEGEKAEAMEAKRRALAEKLGVKDDRPGRGTWALKPLGEPGDIVCPTEFKNRPKLGPAPVRKPGLRLFGPDVSAAICTGRGHADFKYVRALAKELQYHFEKMTGRNVEISKFMPRNGPAIVFETLSGTRERAVVKVEGNVLRIAGVGPGLGHATTYVLEALGCRYIWPGEAGKVIPLKDEVVLPAGLSLDFTPALAVRGIRMYGLHPGTRLWNSLEKIGFDPPEFQKLRDAAYTDHPGNRGFFQWHGVNDTESARGYCSTNSLYRWGHSFGDYAARFGESHPEWFALQSDGTRRPRDDRPTFCMSNEALLDQAAADIIEEFRKEPEVIALSVCLPDGGYSSPCMCENCRRLDPVNAPPGVVGVFRPQRRRYPYVSFTDRTLWFSNRIIERVKKVFPDKKLTFYAYAGYKLPPVKERPDKDLIILSVAGADYAKASTRYAAQHDVAAWSSFGNSVLWRPNVFWGFSHSSTPENQARPCFEDLELFKVNGVIGTDFDCMGGAWSQKGLMYYMCAKAHLNPDRMDYETLYADYCEAGFGPAAAEIRKYFDALEAYGLAAAEKELSGLDYRNGFDRAAFSAMLDAAAAKATGRDDVLRRIAILKTGIEYSKRVADIMALYYKRNYKGKDADMKAAQVEFVDYIHRKSREPDSLVAFNPSGFGFYLLALRSYQSPTAKPKK